MRKLILLSFALCLVWNSFSQDTSGVSANTAKLKAGDPVTLQQLNRVTVGFGIGPSALFSSPTDPFLAPGTDELQLQLLNRYNLVISTIFTLKFGKIGTSDQGLYRITDVQGKTAEKLRFWDRLTMNVGLNLVETDLTSVAFNKSVDGGFGFGYMFGEDINLSWFLDFNSYRQLRKFIIDNYEGQQIPDGTGFLNALDSQDNNLFYSRRILGTSLKLVITLGNRKKDGSTTTVRI